MRLLKNLQERIRGERRSKFRYALYAKRIPAHCVRKSGRRLSSGLRAQLSEPGTTDFSSGNLVVVGSAGGLAPFLLGSIISRAKSATIKATTTRTPVGVAMKSRMESIA